MHCAKVVTVWWMLEAGHWADTEHWLLQFQWQEPVRPQHADPQETQGDLLQCCSAAVWRQADNVALCRHLSRGPLLWPWWSTCWQLWSGVRSPWYNHEWFIRTFLYTGTCSASWSLHIFQCLHWYLQTNMAHGWSIVLFVLNIAADYYLYSIIGLDPVKKKTQCLKWTPGWDIGWSWQLCLYQVHILVLTVHLYCDAYCLLYRGYPG